MRMYRSGTPSRWIVALAVLFGTGCGSSSSGPVVEPDPNLKAVPLESERARARTGEGPLAGLRVIELADEKGQWCGKLLADLGADVIKIERPGGSDERRIGPQGRDDCGHDRPDG